MRAFPCRCAAASSYQERVKLAYVAHSQRCALLLDEDGVCRAVVPKVDLSDHLVQATKRCVGAQFVATLDPDVEGLLGHEPRVGKSILLAAVETGRVALLRFGPLLAFEEYDELRHAPLLGRVAIPVLPTSMPSLEAVIRQEQPELAATLFRGENDVRGARAEALVGEETVNGDKADVTSSELTRPGPIISSPAVTTFLKEVSELADASYSQPSVNDAGIPTTRSSSLLVEDLLVDDDPSVSDTRVSLYPDDSDIEIVTSSFARISSDDLEPDNPDEPAPTVRRSGFIIRGVPLAADTTPDLPDIPDDDETRRFARSDAANEAPTTKRGLGPAVLLAQRMTP